MPRRKPFHLWILLVMVLALDLPVRASGRAAAAQRPPNIVFIVADDLGYGDIGAYGQKRIRTPNLDRMAAEGMRFTQHYSGNAVCAPSRCVLMTGRHPGHAFIRDNRELKPEGQWPLPEDTATLPRLLQSAGYATGAFGKWGLGGPGSSGAPRRQGIDRFFGYNCQRLAHNYYPTHLWDDDRKVPLDNPDFSPYQRFPTNGNPSEAAAYIPYSGREYAPDRIASEALRFVDAHKDHPFLLFFPTTVPHLALQVPEDSLAEYAGRFPEQPYLGQSGYLPHRAPRAAYAAMVTRLDREIGRIMSRITELGLDDQTLFVFTSDNGPLYDQLGGTDTDFFDSAGGLRGRKGALHEGGIRVPCIVRWKGHVPAGKTSDRVTAFEDWMPTLLDLAGLGHLTPATLDGVSFKKTLLGEKQKPRDFLYREFPGYEGWQMIRTGDWKLVRHQLNTPKDKPKPQVLELFNLRRDPTESQDVSGSEPARVRRLLKLMGRQHTASKDFPFPVLDAGEPASGRHSTAGIDVRRP